MSLMGRHTSNHSESPVRGWGSPHRRSPSGRDHRSSHRDSSPVREKLSSRGRSPKRERSHSHSPFARHKGSQRGSSPPATEKISSRAKSPRREKSRSPSPRTKRLRRVQAEEEVEKLVDRDYEKNHRKGDDKDKRRVKETEKLSEREHERNYSKGDDKSTRREREVERDHERNRGRSDDKNSHRERGTDKENGSERKERRSGRDEVDEKSSRGRQRRSPSPSDRHHKSKRRSRSPQSDVDIRERDEVRNSRASEQRNGDEDSLAKMKAAEEALEAKKKQEPSFELSGKLAAETNRVRGVTLLFNEPSEARKPDIRWRLYVFKGGEMLNEPLYIHRQSCYLFGRERRVADIPTDHPSCSKQHAVIQFRQVEKEQPDGTISKQVRPYLMDLGSTNKTFLNDNPIEPQRYYELVEEDTIKFGNSSREYVLLHENSVT